MFVITLLGGCTVGGRTNLAAADAIDVVAESLAGQLAEYHREILAGDQARTRRAVDALIERMRQNPPDDDPVAGHRDAFLLAIGRIDADRKTEWHRQNVAMDHLAILGEIADGLRRMAHETTSVDDEFRRHLVPLLGGLARSRFDGLAKEESDR